MKRVVSAAILAVLVLTACNGGEAGQETPNPTATPIGSGTAITATPSPVVQAQCPEPTACPGPTPCPPAPTCPEPITCPTCPTCPESVTCPKCLACPQAIPCPDCPTAFGSDADFCASMKVLIETAEIQVDVAEEGKLVGKTGADARTTLADAQRLFDQECQGVPLAKPSALASACAVAGEQVGMFQRELLYNPDPQAQTWVSQLDSIIYEYCKP